MRSRPATRTALLVVSCSPSRCAMQRAPSNSRSQERLFLRRALRVGSTDLSPHLHDSQRLLKLTAQSFRTLGGGHNAKVSPNAHDAFTGTPSGSSPSRTARNASSTAIRSAQDISRLHWRYSPPETEPPQHEIDARLCTNCGGRNFFVETTGKMENNSSAFLIDVLAHLEPFFGHGQHVAFASHPHI
jgi:hypothetical protein